MGSKRIGSGMHPAIRQHFSVGLSGNGVFKTSTVPQKRNAQNAPMRQRMQPMARNESSQNGNDNLNHDFAKNKNGSAPKCTAVLNITFSY